MGKIMAESGVGLVYGGGGIGLMGVIARRILDDGGHVTGVIPERLHDLDLSLEGISELVVAKDMHQRKKVMFEKSDAFLALPGGIGTLDEIVEILTGAQLGLHQKPLLLLNHKGYWQPFLTLLDHIIDQGFSDQHLRNLYQVVESPDQVLATASRHLQKPRRVQKH